LDNNEGKIAAVKEIFNATGASKATQKTIEEYTLKAFEILEQMNISEDKKAVLKAFGENLMKRKV
jgi:geranylgeranyl diphosphate synthase type II